MNNYIESIKREKLGAKFEIELDPRVNFVIGKNGVGKTTLLKAIATDKDLSVKYIGQNTLRAYFDVKEEATNFKNSMEFGNALSKFAQKITEIPHLMCISTEDKFPLAFVMSSCHNCHIVNQTVLSIPDILVLVFYKLWELQRSGVTIAIIDNIDICCLHPELQWKLLPALMECFPEMQFIITTNSPILLSSVKSNIIDLEDDGNVLNFVSHYGSPIGNILTLVMGSDEIPPKLSETSREIGILIMQREYEAAREKVKEIESEYGETNSVVYHWKYELMMD